MKRAVTLAVVATALVVSAASQSASGGVRTLDPVDRDFRVGDVEDSRYQASSVAPAGVYWLDRLNSYRATAGLSPTSQNTAWSEGARLHSVYLTTNNRTGHSEDPALPGYTAAGAAAGASGNVVSSGVATISDSEAIDGWMTAPFHALGILDPRLAVSAFGSSSEGSGGSGVRSAATLDVIRGIDANIAWPQQAVIWPGPNSTVPVDRYNGDEWPDPLDSCPSNWGLPSGLPIIVMFPQDPLGVSAHMTSAGAPVELCVFSAGDYRNSVSDAQALGRTILESRNAAVVIPRHPLAEGQQHSVTVSATNSGGAPMTASSVFRVSPAPFGGIPVWAELQPGATGHWLVTSTGLVTAAGTAPSLGGMAGTLLARPVVAMQTTPSGDGYWLLASDGGIFTFGAAQFHGSAGAIPLSSDVVAMEATSTGLGYWLVTATGQVLPYGDARHFGDASPFPLIAPIVDLARTPDDNGYWLVAADGGIFTFGGAKFHGSAGAIQLAEEIVAMEPTALGNGYWLLATDGGIFTYGKATFHGSAGATSLPSPVRTMVRTPSDLGYWLLTDLGVILVYGDATPPY
jgi:uncharacterized protein YkwD